MLGVHILLVCAYGTEMLYTDVRESKYRCCPYPITTHMVAYTSMCVYLTCT